MTENKKQEVQQAFKDAIRHAIDAIGINQFKKCSFFAFSRAKEQKGK